MNFWQNLNNKLQSVQKISMHFIEMLNGFLSPVLKHKFFVGMIALTIYMNPVAILPGVWAVFTAPSIEGVSLLMWVTFALIQLAIMFEGIRVRSAPMFWSMLLSAALSITIIITIFIRG